MSSRSPVRPGLLVAALTALATLPFAAAQISTPIVPPPPRPPAFTPNDPYFAPNLALSHPGQWYLLNRAPGQLTFSYTLAGQTITANATNVGLDINVSGAWQRGVTGFGVAIGIVGITGIQSTHPDLAPGYRADLSRQFSQDPAIAGQPQGPVTVDDNHDTAVAGIAVARGGNGIGMTGVAPLAGVAGFRVDNADNTINPAANQNYIDADYFASGVTSAGRITGYAEVSVRNRSYARTTPFAQEDPRSIAALNTTANNNVVNIFAAGNFRGTPMEDTGRMQRNSLASAIAVAALGSDGKFADYSNYGASIFVTAPGARLDNTGLLSPTLDRTDNAGYNPGSFVGDLFPDRNYTSIFNGTSATAPLVSGIVALGKEVNPFLDARMAQHAFATTSRVVDGSDASATGRWQTNGAGLRFNPNYGFGLVDATAFVNRVEQIAFVTAPQTFTSGTVNVAAASRPINGTGKTETFTLAASALGGTRLPLEAVEVTVDIASSNRSALQGTLTSPAGTTGTFMTASNHLSGYAPIFADPTPTAPLQWTFTANNFWGEDPVGAWRVNVSQRDGGAATWNSYALTFHLGQMVLENANLTLSSNTTAHAAVLDSASTVMRIAPGATFSVRDEVWVNSGTLRVDGRLQDLTSAGLVRSRLRLNGGQLTGTGTIATSLGVVNTAGTVRPGDAGVVGTLTIEGNYTQESRGWLEIDVGANNQTDALVIRNGTAVLGGTLRVRPVPGAEIVAGTIGPIVRVESGELVTGAFQTIDGARVRPTLTLRRAPSIGSVYALEAVRDYLVADVSAGFTTADRRMAEYLNRVSALPARPFENLLRAIDRQPTAGAAAAAIHAIEPFSPGLAPHVALATDASRLDAILRRARIDRIENAGASRGVFVETSYARAALDGTVDRSPHRFHDRGVLAGCEMRRGAQLSGGVFLGVSESRGLLERTGSKLDGAHRAIGAHATWTSGPWYGAVAGEYGWGRFKRTRQLVFPGVTEQLRSDSDASQLNGVLELGGAMTTGAWEHRLFASGRFQRATIDRYTEPGAFGWDVDEQRARSAVGSLGYEISGIVKLGVVKLQPFASLLYAHEFRGGRDQLTARLTGATAGDLAVQTGHADRDFATAQGGVAWCLRNGSRLYAAASADAGQSDASRHAFHAGFWKRF